MFELLALLATAQNLAAFLTGVAASHVANKIPRKADFDGHAARCFEQAAERWRVIDEVHAALFPKVSTFEKWQAFIASTPNEQLWVSAELIELWIDELHKDPECAQKAIELKLDQQDIKIQSAIKKIDSVAEHLQRIEDYLHRFSTCGRVKFDGVPHYIKRYCAPSGTNASFLYYAGIDNDKTLLDYLLSNEEESKVAPKLILYGGMQTGKSTELEQLGYYLKQSGRYLPILIKLKNIPSLTRAELPDRLELEGLPIVLLIDAVDETSERQFCTLMHDISDYAYHYSAMPMVVSCRTNFRKDSLAVGFTPIDLLPLKTLEASNFAAQVLGSKATQFFTQINQMQLQSLASIPMTLKILTEYFNDRGTLPSSRSEVYDIIFHKALNEETKKGVTDDLITEEEEQQYLERLAALMLLRGPRSLTETELKQTYVTQNESKFDHLRYGILEKDDSDKYMFVNNAMQELLASYFIFRCKTVDNVKKLVCLEGTEQVSPSWFNAMLLFLEQLHSKKTEWVQDILKWLKVNGKNLLIHDEAKQLITADERAKLIIEILEQCKQANHHFIAFGDEFQAHPRELPVLLVQYLLDEWRKVQAPNNHTRNLQLLTSIIDWEMLQVRDKQLADALQDQLFLNFNNSVFTGDNSYCAYAALSSKHFMTDAFTDRLYNVVKARTGICDYTMMVSRICLLADTSIYIDYLDRAERALVPDKTTYHYHEREPLYKAVRKVTTRDAVITALKITARDTFWHFANSKVIAQQTTQDLLQKAEHFLVKQNDPELVQSKADAENKQNQYLYHIPQPTPEQQQRNLEQLQAEINQFCDFIFFRGQARAYLTDPLGDGSHIPLDITTIYMNKRKGGSYTDKPNQFVVNFLIHHASGFDGRGNMLINDQKARAALNNDRLYLEYRMRELYRYMRGDVSGIVITGSQKQLCYNTAQEILDDMIAHPRVKGCPQDAPLVLSFLINGHIHVGTSHDAIWSLLHYVAVPIDNRSISTLYDELNDTSLLLYIQNLIGEQQLLSILYELVEYYLPMNPQRIDSRKLTMWVDYLISAHHQNTIDLLKDRVLTLAPMWDVWMSYLVKEGSKIALLKARAETEGTGWLLSELTSLLMSDSTQHPWILEQLERHYSNYSYPQMGNRLRMLYRLGSSNALRLTLSNYHVLDIYANNEFDYKSVESISLLCQMYNLCVSMTYSMSAQQSILTSLRNIAMIDNNCLREVQDIVPVIIKILGPNAFTPKEWVLRLENEFRLLKSQNKDVPTLISFLQGVEN